jgi:hypothetical protein
MLPSDREEVEYAGELLADVVEDEEDDDNTVVVVVVVELGLLTLLLLLLLLVLMLLLLLLTMAGADDSRVAMNAASNCLCSSLSLSISSLIFFICDIILAMNCMVSSAGGAE